MSSDEVHPFVTSVKSLSNVPLVHSALNELDTERGNLTGGVCVVEYIERIVLLTGALVDVTATVDGGGGVHTLVTCELIELQLRILLEVNGTVVVDDDAISSEAVSGASVVEFSSKHVSFLTMAIASAAEYSRRTCGRGRERE